MYNKFNILKHKLHTGFCLHTTEPKDKREFLGESVASLPHRPAPTSYSPNNISFNYK